MSGIMLAALGGGKAIRLFDKAIAVRSNFATVAVTNAAFWLAMTWFDPSDSNGAFSYSISKTGGSSKLAFYGISTGAANNGNDTGTSRTPTYKFFVTGLNSGETVTADFAITASYAGYQAGIGTLSVTVSR